MLNKMNHLQKNTCKEILKNIFKPKYKKSYSKQGEDLYAEKMLWKMLGGAPEGFT